MSSLLTLVSVSGLADLALESAAVMLLAMVVAVLLGRASAARRHLVWCLAVVSLLLLPVLSLALPAWRVTWLPQWTAEQTRVAAVEPTNPMQTNALQADLAQAVGAENPHPSPLPEEDMSAIETHNLLPATNDATGDAADGIRSVPATLDHGTRSVMPASLWLTIAWGAGGLLSLVPLAMGLCQLAALHGRSRVIGERRWLTLLDELRRQLAVRRGVQLRQCDAALTPLTWGALRPILLVPAEASAWPDERRRLMLLHELAHIRRWDWLTQLIAHLACALYWFNPLVWLAARQMRIERERACDDLVLASGARASDYAQELLTLAAGLSNSRLSALVAVPMARRGALEDRLRGILDSRRSRAALTTAAVCLGAALAAAAILPLAMLRAAPPKPPTSLGTVIQNASPEKEKPATEKPVDKSAEKPAEPPAAKTITIRGKVVDDATMEPIKSLTVQAGKFDPPVPKKVIWGWKEDRSSAADGSFSTTVEWAEGWTARILAEGYFPQPLIASAPPADKEEIEVTIRLKRVPAKVHGVVLDHTGKPVSGASVFAVGPAGLTLLAGQAWVQVPGGPGGTKGYKNDSAKFVLTDEQGQFELAPGSSTSLAISYAKLDAWAVAIPASGDMLIRLPEPARVEINLDIDGADKESVIFYQLLPNYMTEEFKNVVTTRWVSMANPGKLSLTALPPGKYQICRRPGRILDRELIELAPGETKTIDYVRGKGARVRGKVAWPKDAELAGITVSIVGETTHKSPFDQFEWNNVFASPSIGDDGTFLTERVPPGTYQLVAYAFKPLTEQQRRRTGAIAPSYHAQVKIEVPAEGEVTADDLALKPIRAEEPKPEPPAKEKPAAEQPAEKPIEKPVEAAAAPQRDPLLGKEAAARVEKFRPSFSKAQAGVELGLSLASDRKVFHLGERMPLEFVIRNVSEKTLHVEHGLYPPHTPPTVFDAGGKQHAIEPIYLFGATRLYRDILKPNEVAVYRHLGLGLGETPSPPGTFWHPFLKNADAVPGKYRLSQPVRLTVREEGDDTGGTPLNTATGEIDFEIALADPKKDAEKPGERTAENPAEQQAAKSLSIRGKVVDDKTSKPIATFIVHGGKFDAANPKQVIWGGREELPSAAGGSFTTSVGGAEGWTARILADGYFPQPVLTAPPPTDKEELTVTVRLTPVPERVRGVVLDHTGKPVKDAAVYAVGPKGLNLYGGQAWALGREVKKDTEARPVQTDEQGRFDLPTGGARSLAVSHIGFDRWHEVIPASGEITIRLPEPARIEITLDIEGADKESLVFYQIISHLDSAYGSVLTSRYVTVANPGKLTLAAMSPGRYQIWRSPVRMLDREFCELAPGETKKLDYVRPTGARVRGKVTWPADAKLRGAFVIIVNEKYETAAFGGHNWQRTYSAVQTGEDGTFLTERIPPGTQHLAAYAYSSSTSNLSGFGGFIGPSHYAQMTIEVPVEGEVKVADVELKRPGK